MNRMSEISLRNQRHDRYFFYKTTFCVLPDTTKMCETLCEWIDKLLLKPLPEVCRHWPHRCTKRKSVFEIIRKNCVRRRHLHIKTAAKRDFCQQSILSELTSFWRHTKIQNVQLRIFSWCLVRTNLRIMNSAINNYANCYSY